MTIRIRDIHHYLVPHGKGKHAVFPDETHVWVGRAVPRWGLKASPLGNPYRVGVAPYFYSREQAVKMFAIDLRHAIRRAHGEGFRERTEMPMVKELAHLHALHQKHDLTLVCCNNWDGEGDAPGLCHAEVIREELLREPAGV